jgi:nitrite reductase/ring-hydroxylating ferredoxin subunit
MRSDTDQPTLSEATPTPFMIRACASAELAPGEAVQVDTVPPIAVFNVDGQFYATEDTCTHELSSLADGYVEGDVVECAWHFAKFCVRNGEVRGLPATKPLRTFKVSVVDGVVLVDISGGQVSPPATLT